MSQSRGMSLVEAVTNVVAGYVLAVFGQLAFFPVVGLDVTVRQSLLIGVLFTSLSLVRSFVLRRLFNGCVCRRIA